MIKRFARRIGKSERGAAILEFAIAVPVFLALVFGIIEFAWILNGHITLTGAAREGARLAIVSEYTGKRDDDIKTVIRNQPRTNQKRPEAIRINNPDDGEGVVKIEEAKLPLLVGIFPFIDNPHVINNTIATMMEE